MTVIVTGAAGFIGSAVALALLARGEKVVGIDNINDYYDQNLKKARLERLLQCKTFEFHKVDIAEPTPVKTVFTKYPNITGIIHLAAQAGVRYSLVNPYAYTRANIEGHLVLMEAAKNLDKLTHFIYASSSSVYGANKGFPFSTQDRTDSPVSLYAATKKSMELLSESYARMWGMPLTGLRFFTVYGPWGRPDMAAFIFVRKMLAGEPIQVFNNGDMKRDFTYIDDIVAGIVACLEKPPNNASKQNECPHALYNIGNNRSEYLMHFIEVLEGVLGIKAEMDFQPMQPGDVKETYADIGATRRDFGFDPKTTIEEGLPKFVAWYREYYGI